jgi:hypothetical protein
MAREHDREDLLAEAKALVERASLKLEGCDHEVLVGFRRDGSASIYFGPDRVYHLASEGQLRRAFVEGLLYKAERGRLVALDRRRSPDAVELLRHEPSAAEQAAFVADAQRHLGGLLDALARGHYRIAGKVPADRDVIGRAAGWLSRIATRLTVAESARAQ